MIRARRRDERSRAPLAYAFVRARAFLLSLAACCALAASASAASLEDYRTRVAEASSLAEQLWLFDAPEEWDDERERLSEEARVVGELRAALPVRERIERAGGSVEVDNGWLHAELDKYAALAPGDGEKKQRLIATIQDRLAALEAQLELEAATAAGARDKEAEKGRLESILRRAEYNEEASKGGALEQLLAWLESLLQRFLPERRGMSPGPARTFSIIARVFVYALAAAVIGFVLWRYGPQLWSRIGTGRKAKGREARVVLGERLEADQSSADLVEEAERLARAGDLRGAIRKAYIAVLCELGDRGLIRLAHHKTNRDYLASLRQSAELYGLMRPLTLDYERHWYGFAPATDPDWDAYRALCRRAIQT